MSKNVQGILQTHQNLYVLAAARCKSSSHHRFQVVDVGGIACQHQPDRLCSQTLLCAESEDEWKLSRWEDRKWR